MEAGKHLMGEKPFGIDLAANDAILAAVREASGLFRAVRVAVGVFPGGPADRADDRGRSLRPDHRSQRWLPALQRSRSQQAHQLETHDRIQRRVRRHGRPGSARLRHAVPGRLDPAERPGGPVQHHARAARWQRRHGPLRDLGQCYAVVRGPRSCLRQRVPAASKTHRIAPGQKNNWYLEI